MSYFIIQTRNKYNIHFVISISKDGEPLKVFEGLENPKQHGIPRSFSLGTPEREVFLPTDASGKILKGNHSLVN